MVENKISKSNDKPKVTAAPTVEQIISDRITLVSIFVLI
jgi:hypothetical protein